MSGLLLDTYIINDLINSPARLSVEARKAIESHTGSLYASAASAMELAFHERDGRTRFAVPVVELRSHLEEAGIFVLPVSWESLARAVAVDVPHRDPFDRILVATALDHGLTLVTNDAQIRRCPALQCVG